MAQILVVHDFPSIRRVCQVPLERAGHTVALAADGGTAWELLQKTRFDLVISEIILPVCDGWQLYARMRGSEATHDIPFLLFAIRYNTDSLGEVRARNAVLLALHAPIHRAYFLIKPFNPSRMVSFVRQILVAEVPDGSLQS